MPYRALPRLLALNEKQASQDTEQISFFRLIIDLAEEDSAGCEKVSRWLRAVSHSGAAIPWSTFEELLNVGLPQASNTADDTTIRMNLLAAIEANSSPSSEEHQLNLVSRILLDRLAIKLHAPATYTMGDHR